MDKHRRELNTRIDALRAEQNKLSGEIEEPGIDLGNDGSLGGVTELGPRQTPPLPVPEG